MELLGLTFNLHSPAERQRSLTALHVALYAPDDAATFVSLVRMGSSAARCNGTASF